MPALFEAYVTNLGKYNEGELVGEYLKFPTTPEEVQALLKRIGIDGVRYEEIFITDFDGDVLGLYDHLGEYENIDELNHLARVISELDQGDLEKFEAVIDSGEYTGSVKELINLAQNLDCFEFYPGVTDDETLGRIYVEDMEAIDVPEHLLILFTTAKDYLKGVMNGKTTIPTKAWKTEYAKLTAERKTLNQRYLALKEEVKEAEQIRKSIYSIGPVKIYAQNCLQAPAE